MRFRPITMGLFVISGLHPLGASAAMYRRLSSLRKARQSPTWEDLSRLDSPLYILSRIFGLKSVPHFRRK
jgi:hypothetical protein